MQDASYAIIGLGNIGRILVQRLLAGPARPSQLVVCDSERPRTELVARESGVSAATLDDDAVSSADVLMITTPPKAAQEVIRRLAPRMHPGQVVLSFAAAVPLQSIEDLVPPGVQVSRIMPNAPSLVGRGMNPVAFGVGVTAEAKARISAILDELGEHLEVRDDQMNWCVGLSGAAMRSLLPALEGMTQAGIEAGLTAEDARRVAAQVMLGTAALVLETGLSFDEIRALTPMQTVDEAALAALYLEAARAARDKIDQLQAKLSAG